MRTTAQILRDYRGPAIFSFGFRPFFLLASIWSALAVPLWLLPFLGVGESWAAIFTRDWHVHEMLFGYTAAVIVGYMTIAGANWTGHYPVAGRPIVLLVALWIAGRAAMLAYPILGLTAAVIDAAFLISFSLALWREQLAATNSRVLAPSIVITLLAIANVGFHARMIAPAIGPASERMTIGLITFLIALMGGRLVPSFTRNWMAQRKITPQPAPYGRFDVVTLSATGTGIASWIALPFSPFSGTLLTIAGMGLLVRLLRWRGWVAARDGMVLILHLAYFWCALGVAMLGASVLLPADIPGTAAIHALTAGAIGVMTLAVMTRTSLSHTGRERRANYATLLIYLLANLAALTRTVAPFVFSAYAELLLLSAIFWSLAFGLFALVYGPMLARSWHRKI
ncbi:NnrS family protein [Hyphomicrobium denitrificans 1NES1]|uniref:NnrS family protein n=1 Tax=Hyphomicrobium denitrificans 1NES1 TaxID=670307 RepID=N0B870_9HYPH|nr:NnrS family protein [Hyphomicrobium denitrificans]AGK56741.1 NnrS family protein [Hyphomicrobium denitrificans 1NES1]